ncbi:uncharacterized protein TNCV_3228221 [Trichonephila clavipes]|nr:uncharacterized protein TNCV_3228221 [Trichonephila clavipes]
MCCTSIEDALKRDTSLPDLYALQRQIMDKFARLDTVQEHILELLLGDETLSGEYEDDFNKAEKYRDKMNQYLRSWKSLGRTQKKFADFLEPLVESCLPEAVLRAWERCRNAETTSEGQDRGRSLDRLMTFLRKEVESEEMILLASTGLGSTQRQKVKANAEEPSLATSVALVNTEGERSGMMAIGTMLGLTLMGKSSQEVNDNTEVSVPAIRERQLSMFLNQLNVKELWDLETIGIRDPVENIKSEIQHSDMIERFQKDIKILPSGRYEVALPFKIEGQLRDNRGLTLKRLKRTCKKMGEKNSLKEYASVFEEWEALKIIEK